MLFFGIYPEHIREVFIVVVLYRRVVLAVVLLECIKCYLAILIPDKLCLFLRELIQRCRYLGKILNKFSKISTETKVNF
jgi:hypothetical protein